ncbi:SDR family NAD(P)-dependent oxidoreductase [Roseospira goensis]|uniref:NAD(P)-dependent dehydrogenase (Short-subunit alcohol dehydrogenase family) n=1 Tax=Roseospira goensis TaxID=391922 RepID=A0A7W6WKI5_9PROT|nr:SDR family oxidoreductase [Roseospira goensis]MBB4286140.1 NAD(P)-dependent dehydrogenase (short-subunit alcohol dehydrogenase family) [Roseospira goensis]
MAPAPVLILGASGGVGAALARRLAALGTPLVLHGRDADRLAGVAEDLSDAVLATRSADALDPEDLTAAVAALAEAAGGRLSGLAYCIGSIPLMPLKRVTAGAMAETYALNVTGALIAVQAAAPALGAAAGGGAVVLFSSVAAGRGFPNHAVIGAAKAGVEGLTRSLAAELAPKVRVNAIAPSLTRTAMAAPLTASEAMVKGLAKAHPLPRLGAAEDQAAMAAVLLDPAHGWVTGQVIGVDGGRGALVGKG